MLVSFKKHMKTCSVGARGKGKIRSLKYTEEATKKRKNLKWQQVLYPPSILMTLTFPPVFLIFCSPFFILPTLCAVLCLYTVQYTSRDLNTACFSQLLMNLKVLMRANSSFTSHACFLAVACIFFPHCSHQTTLCWKIQQLTVTSSNSCSFSV